MALAFTIAISMAACGGQGEASQDQEGAHQEEEMHDHGDSMHSHDEGTEDHDHEAMMEAAEGSDLLAIPEGAKVFFANLQDGQKLSSPVKVEFGIEGMEVEPAGELNEGKGHHHIIIDGNFIERGVIVPADSMNIHFGKGQTETELELSAGKHTLTMQFADGYHQSYGEQMSATITVEIE